jgi:phosphomannomutase
LTGFKWLARAGQHLVFAYEEALGLCVDPDAVRDKDGISAAVLAADLAASRKAAGSSLQAALDELAVRHGVHLTEQLSVRLTDRARIDALMSRLRATPPSSLAGVDVTAEDLLPLTDGVRLTGPGLRVVVRPSGTESKLKAYLQVVREVSGTLDATRCAAASTLAALRDDVQHLLSD